MIQLIGLIVANYVNWRFFQALAPKDGMRECPLVRLILVLAILANILFTVGLLMMGTTK